MNIIALDIDDYIRYKLKIFKKEIK